MHTWYRIDGKQIFSNLLRGPLGFGPIRCLMDINIPSSKRVKLKTCISRSLDIGFS